MEEDRTQKKERIFEAAFDSFLVKGYTNTKMSEIAANAGVAKATLYEYFASKEALFEELLHTKVTLPYLSFEARLQKHDSCASRIRSFMRMEMDFFSDFMEEKDILPNLLLHTEFIGNATIASVAQRIIAFKFRVICGLLREGMERGEFRRGDPFTMAACMIGAFNFFAACACKAHFFDLPFHLPESAEAEAAFFSVLFEGVNAPSQGERGV
jgi:AcrR family transcriptional regulator